MKKMFRKRSVVSVASLLSVSILAVTVQFSAGPIYASYEAQASKGNSNEVKIPYDAHGTEVIEKRTEYSKTFLNTDGLYRNEISLQPIHFKDSNGKWQDIDNTLRFNKSTNSYENGGNAFGVEFKSDQSDSGYFELKDKNRNMKLELMPIDTTNETPDFSTEKVSGNEITYNDVYTNVDIHYEVGNDRIKEGIVYNEKPQAGFPSDFTYKMDLTGLEVKEEGGNLVLCDAITHQALYYFDAPVMYDSYKPDGFVAANGVISIPEEATSSDIKLDYEVQGNNLFIHLIPNQEWLNDSKRVFPLTIDPTLVKLQSSTYVQDTNLRSSFPTQTGGNDLELGAGMSGGNVIRSLVKFDLSSIPGAVTILSSNLDMWFTSTNNATASQNMGIYRVTSTWEENQASWNYATTTPSDPWTTAGGDYNTTKLASITGLTSPPALSSGPVKTSIPISTVQAWKDGTAQNYGLLIKSDAEGTNVYKKFASSESTLGLSYQPMLVVSYRTNARLGLEDYWPYDAHTLTGGTSYANQTTLNNIVQYSDFYLPNRGGFGLNFTRTYNSKSKEKSAMGYGWVFTGSEKLFIGIKGSANIIDYADEDGTDHEFNYSSTTGTFLSGPGKYMSIKKETDNVTYTLTDKFGYKSTFKVMQSGNDMDVKVAYITSKFDRHGNKINFVYNTNNVLTNIVSDFGGGITRSIDFTYNGNGLISSATSAGNKYTYTYDSSGRLLYADQLKVAATNTISRTTFTYANGYMSNITDANGKSTDFTYVSGYLSQIQDPLVDVIDQGTSAQKRPTTKFSLDNATLTSTVTFPSGNTATYHTNSNYVVDVEYKDGIYTYYDLDSNYNPLTISEDIRYPLNYITAKSIIYTYDSNGNVTSTQDPEYNTTSSTYTTYCNLASRTDEDGNTTSYSYKTNGDLITQVNPDSTTEIYTYDSYGDLTSIKHADLSVETNQINYTNLQQTKSVTDRTGKVTTTVTDANGNVISRTDGNQKTYQYVYNSNNELISVIDPYNKTTNYAYDANGNMTSVTNANSVVTTQNTFDAQNKLISETNALGKVKSYKYDLNGNLNVIELPNGHKIYNEVDANGLTKSIKIDTAYKYGFVYDDLNRLTNVCLASQTCTTTNAMKLIAYNDADDTINSVTDRGNTILYTYNDLVTASNRKMQYTVNGTTSSLLHSFSNMDQLTNIYKNGSTSSLVSFTYAQNNEPESVNYLNNSSINYSYVSTQLGQPNGTLNEVTLKNTATNVFDKYVLGYDANRNITKVTSTAGVTTYTYDDLNQLISETLPNGKLIEYSYDDVGNRLSKVEKVNGIITDSNNYGFNAGNQLVNVNGQAYTYDDNGNLNSDGVNTYQFNDFNQLESIKNSAGQVIATYTYDESGKRISSTTPAGTIKYFYDGNQVLYETDGNNNKLREYTYTSSGLPATITIGGNTYYYLTNHHGDVVAITNASGGVVATYSYDAWGNILSQSGSLASVNPYRYAGYRYDENSKLYYLMARYYNSDIGGFLSKDPVTGDLHDPSSLNGYNYAYNNPVMIFDPTGEVGILISMGTNAFINLLCYIIPLLVDHGQNFYKHINYRTMGIEIMKGAISGIIGFNIGKIKTLRMLAKPLRRVFDAHLAPLTYFLMNFRSGYSGEGLYEEILFALIGNKGTVIYTTYKSIVKKAKKKSLFSIFS